MGVSELRVFGIRHHGPGSSKSLLGALEEFGPDIVLIEGPPEADSVLASAIHADIQPPVALLIYHPDEPGNAAFYPFAEFSPEWNAIRFGLQRGLPVRMIDLPIGAQGVEEEGSPDDPLGEIARLAGYEDRERWWEAAFERRRDPAEVFDAVRLLMKEAREDFALPVESAAREAHMRQQVRKAEGEGFAKIAVVCGAWHVPAFEKKVSATADMTLLRGRPKSKHLATWVPWTYDRLAADSGYAAGVVSPAYYELLWRSTPDEVASGWLLRTARLLREEDLDASPASVIEAVRLADALASLRGHAVPGLEELREAAWSVLCQANDVPMRLVERRLVVGERMGHVPEDTPQAPLQADLAAWQKRLRLKPEALERTLELDLRKENDLDRSRLLHRLILLEVPWGELLPEGNRKSTFHENWRLGWKAEFAVNLVAGSRWGGTVESAATASLVDAARSTEELSELGQMAQAALLADLQNAIPAVMLRLENVAAVSRDLGDLLDALPPLGRVMRYGNVRRTDVGAVGQVFGTVLTRACLGLPAACASLDDEAAAAMADRIDAVADTVALLEDPEQRFEWRIALGQVADQATGHGLVVGRATRLLLDAKMLTAEETAIRLGRLSSPGTPALTTAQWLEGFLGSSGQILLHDHELWSLIDAWMAGLGQEVFEDLVPLLRRTFSQFPKPERRQLGELASRGKSEGGAGPQQYDEARAARVVPIVQTILGVSVEVKG
ncbi:hypothetical protein EON79_04160 [bacterium]|nr:MAG: hypothetical protein EON79_04160 [bacterium]